MSTLVFDGANRTLTLLNSSDQPVGQWYANNIVDSLATIRFVPNRTYIIVDQNHTHRHSGSADTRNGAYGTFGIIRMQTFASEGQLHSGVGVHAGRANQGGPDHATMGCIRTSESAMEAITRHMRTDPLRSISVVNNRVQVNRSPHHLADHHDRRATQNDNHNHSGIHHSPQATNSNRETMTLQVGHGAKTSHTLQSSDYVITPRKK